MPAKRGRVKPKRYLTPEPEPAPRRAKLKAMFKDIEDGPSKEETPGKGRGRPKKGEAEEKSKAKGKGKTPAKKPKKEEEPGAGGTKNSKLLKEIEAELAEINGTTSRKKTPRKRRNSAPKPVVIEPLLDKDRPALEGFEPELSDEPEEQLSPATQFKQELGGGASELSDELVEPPEFGEEATSSVRRSARGRRIHAPTLLGDEAESPDDDEPLAPRPPRKIKRSPPKQLRVKSEKKKMRGGRRRRGSRAPVSDDEEGESIPIDSLEGAINSASSLLDDHSDSSGEQEPTPVSSSHSKPAQPKQSRSGRNVRTPRRPMENDFETDFSTLRRAMNATTSDFAARKRRMNMYANTPEMRYEQDYNPLSYDYFSSSNAFRHTSETARTRPFEENKMEKTLSLMDSNGQIINAPMDREPLLLETHLRAAEPPAGFSGKRHRRSSSHTDMSADRVFYRKHKPGVGKQQGAGERSLLKRLDSGTDSGDHLDSFSTSLTRQQQQQQQRARDPRDMISEMTPPPTQPIVPADDHNYSVSSRYLGDAAQQLMKEESGEGVEARVMNVDHDDLLNQISSSQAPTSAAAAHVSAPAIVVTSGTPALATSSEGVTVPITSVSGVDRESAVPPKEIVIYVGDKPTVVPVLQDESGMSVITLPNGIAEEDIQASLEAAVN